MNGYDQKSTYAPASVGSLYKQGEGLRESSLGRLACGLTGAVGNAGVSARMN